MSASIEGLDSVNDWTLPPQSKDYCRPAQCGKPSVNVHWWW